MNNTNLYNHNNIKHNTIRHYKIPDRSIVSKNVYKKEKNIWQLSLDTIQILLWKNSGVSVTFVKLYISWENYTRIAKVEQHSAQSSNFQSPGRFLRMVLHSRPVYLDVEFRGHIGPFGNFASRCGFFLFVPASHCLTVDWGTVDGNLHEIRKNLSTPQL